MKIVFFQIKIPNWSKIFSNFRKKKNKLLLKYNKFSFKSFWNLDVATADVINKWNNNRKEVAEQQLDKLGGLIGKFWSDVNGIKNVADKPSAYVLFGIFEKSFETLSKKFDETQAKVSRYVI